MEQIETDVLLGSLYPEPERLDELGLPQKALEQLRMSMRLYQQHARMVIRLESHAYPLIRFGVAQWSSGYTGKVLDQEELAVRAGRVVEPLVALGWRPVVCIGEVSCFTMDVVERMAFKGRR
jgi:hypothetical protein